MNHSILRLALVLSLTAFSQLGCGKKDADKASTGDKPAAAAPAPTGDKAAPTAVDLPPECKAFTDAVESLSTCDQIPKRSQDAMKAGYKQMLDSVIRTGDTGEMIKGCRQGQDAIKSTLTTAGC